MIGAQNLIFAYWLPAQIENFQYFRNCTHPMVIQVLQKNLPLKTQKVFLCFLVWIRLGLSGCLRHCSSRSVAAVCFVMISFAKKSAAYTLVSVA